MISETEIQNNLKDLIRSNIDAYLKIQVTSQNSTSMSIREVLFNTAKKRAQLITNLSNSFQLYLNSDLDVKMLSIAGSQIGIVGNREFTIPNLTVLSELQVA